MDFSKIKPAATDESDRRAMAMLSAVAELKKYSPTDCKKLLDHYGDGDWNCVHPDDYDTVREHAETRIAKLKGG